MDINIDIGILMAATPSMIPLGKNDGPKYRYSQVPVVTAGARLESLADITRYWAMMSGTKAANTNGQALYGRTRR